MSSIPPLPSSQPPVTHCESDPDSALASLEDLKLQAFDSTVYQRPTQRWLCGNSCGACAIGPTDKGECQATTECQPRRHNDAWLCNRSPAQGGKCAEGPSADGKCCREVTRCVPELAMRSRRARFVFWCLAAFVGTALIVLSSSWRNEVLAPGGLTEQHAQLLRDKRTERCAECHGAASAGLAEWTLATIVPGRTLGQPQSELCLECHENSLPMETALLAHGMTSEQLTALSKQTAIRLDSDGSQAHQAQMQIACSTCHREHQGANFNLSAVTNEQCASCHQDAFNDFAHHPAFDRWPHERRTRIAFDHAAHQAKYFAEARTSFDCGLCHEPGGRTGVSTINSFEQACASCHQQKIDQSLAEGVQILALPTLDTQALAAEGFQVGQWPPGAAGPFDGTIAPMTQLLLGSDRRAWSALNQFGPDFDFLDIDAGNVDDLEAAHDIAWGIKQLIYDLGTDARGAFRRRLQAALQTNLSDQQAEALSAQLPAALISGVQRRWFPRLASEVPAYRRKIGVPPSGIETRLPAQSQITVGDLPLLTKLGSAGGEWRVDHEVFDLSVLARGHASAFVHSWLELLGRNSKQTLPETAWPLRDLLMSVHGPGQCASCHSVDEDVSQHSPLVGSYGQQRVNWHGADAWPGSSSLTKFSHEPHLLQPGYADCRSCHTIEAKTNVMQSYQEPNPATLVSEFAPISHQDCAGCHHPRGAGDSCLKCHDYHVGEDRSAAVSTAP